MSACEQYLARLNALAEDSYREFSRRIVNSEYPVIGVRVPLIKKLAREVRADERAEVLDGIIADKNRTYESVLFAGLAAAQKGDYGFTREYLKRMIPLFGSWGHTDTVIPALGWTDRDVFLSDFDYLKTAKGIYEVRAYIVYLFDCLTAERIDGVLDTLKTIRAGEYYVDMAIAWLLAEALVRFYEKAVPLIEKGVFPEFIHRKAISKACDSFRVPSEIKAYLKSLRNIRT